MNKFETNFIKETKEKEVFSKISAKDFFAYWCEANEENLKPEFISRQAWNEQVATGESFEGEHLEGNKLYIPEDIKLSELKDVITSLSPNPKEAAASIKQLGRSFEKAGIYLHKFLPDIENGKEIARELSEEFYDYGLQIQEKNPEDSSIEKEKLSLQDIQEIDKWLLGGEAHEKRISRLKKKETKSEKIISTIKKKALGITSESSTIKKGRKELLNVFFGGLERKTSLTGPIHSLQKRVRESIDRKIRQPEIQAKTAVFERGKKNLAQIEVTDFWRKQIQELTEEELKDYLLEREKIREIVQIDKLKKELEKLRKKGDLEKLSDKEFNISEILIDAIDSFSYRHAGWYSGQLAKAAENKEMNCVVASILGGALLEELGINYLPANTKDHSFTFLVTSDDRIYMQDFTPYGSEGDEEEIEVENDEENENEPSKRPQNFTEITEGMMDEFVDLVKFSKQKGNNAELHFKLSDYTQEITVSNSRQKLQGDILCNAAISMAEQGNLLLAMETITTAIDLNPKNRRYQQLKEKLIEVITQNFLNSIG